MLSVKARPITAAIVAGLAAKNWHTGNDIDVLMHAILLTSPNLGLRYLEVSKLRVAWVSLTFGGITLRTGEG